MFKLDRDSFQHILQEETKTDTNKHFQQKRMDQMAFFKKQKILIPEQNQPQPIATLVALPAHALTDLLEVYQWRSQTEYPIVRAHATGTVLNKTQSIININLYPPNHYQQLFQPDEKLYLEVITQPVQLLSNFGPLSFGTFSYAFKEAIVGFQRLFALFGSFSITPSMIVVNNEGRVKVWLSSHYHQNTKNQFNLESKNYHQNLQKAIVSQLKQVFLGYSQNNTTYREFFTFIEHIDNFLELLKKVQEFLSRKKILVVKGIKKQTRKIVKRPLSPNFTLIPKKNVPVFVSPAKNAPFNKRLTVGDGVYGEKMLKNLRSMKNLNVVVSQLQTRQSLSTKSQFISNNLIVESKTLFQGRIVGIQEKKIANRPQVPSRLKKLDSLEKNLQNLFENETEQKPQVSCKKFLGLAAFGKTIRGSRYFQQTKLNQN